MSTPLFHAELLSNIRSITTSIHLPSPSNPSTKLTRLTPSQLQLCHDGETTTLNLPANVTLAAITLFEKSRIILGETKLSYRLPVAPESCPESRTASENYVPWSAVSLSTSTKKVSLRCKSCSSELVPEKTIDTWKDLPSGNWADMMDFWHCHKPETESTQTNAGDRYTGLQRGYAAVNGTGLVELTYFLIARGNCGSAVEKVEVIHPLCFHPCGAGQKEGQQSPKGHNGYLYRYNCPKLITLAGILTLCFWWFYHSLELDKTPGDMEERHDAGDEQRPFEGAVSLLPLGFTALFL